MTAELCPRERIQNDAHSLGVIDDAESVLRAAVNPLHLSKAGRIKRSVLRPSDLRKGQLSAWRACVKPESHVANVLVELEQSVIRRAEKQSLHAILWARAVDIRAIRVIASDVPVKCFFIVDDCACDPSGRKHAQHVHLGYSDQLLNAIGQESDAPCELEALENLKLLLESQSVELAPA